jgi:hypothetical protein
MAAATESLNRTIPVCVKASGWAPARPADKFYCQEIDSSFSMNLRAWEARAKFSGPLKPP